MKKQVLLFILGGILLAGMPSAYALPLWDFNTLPASGAVAGPAGSTVGWGYSITNPDPNHWLSLTGLSADSFLNGVPDGAIFDFPVVGPSTTLSVSYDGTQGLYQFTWDAGAPTGFNNSGTFVLSADWYDGDPLGTGQFVEVAADRSASYFAEVTAAVPHSIPEPATLLLVASGVLGLVGWRRIHPA